MPVLLGFGEAKLVWHERCLARPETPKASGRYGKTRPVTADTMLPQHLQIHCESECRVWKSNSNASASSA